MTPSSPTPQFEASLDKEKGLLIFVYGEVLSGDVTALIYEQGASMMHELGVDNIKGCIIDFSNVKTIANDNMITAQSSSYRLNSSIDLKHVPVAMIVKTAMQRTVVQISMNASPDKSRKRIVNSYEEALTFFSDWQNASSRV